MQKTTIYQPSYLPGTKSELESENTSSVLTLPYKNTIHFTQQYLISHNL